MSAVMFKQGEVQLSLELPQREGCRVCGRPRPGGPQTTTCGRASCVAAELEVLDGEVIEDGELEHAE